MSSLHSKSDLPVTAAQVEAAARLLKGVIHRTPMDRWVRKSKETGANIYLKREDTQDVRSYKIRGAFNLMLQLSDEQRQRGVVCASAGNHAQGVAKACRDLGIEGKIFVPRTTPKQKMDRIRSFGEEFVELIARGSNYDEASQAAHAYSSDSGAMNIPPFDDPRTIAGQGSVAFEIHRQLGRSPDLVIVPVGGGGLLAGVATYFAEHSPETKVVGIEPAGAASMIAALQAGRPVELDSVDTFVDGAAVKRAGELSFEIVAQLGIEIFPLHEGRVASEMLRLYQSEGIIAEPAGALSPGAVGGLGSGEVIEVGPGMDVVCIVSGGNNDISRYAEVEERSLIFEGLRHYFIVNFPQEPGALRRFLDQVLGPDDDISLFEYVKRSNRETGPAIVGITLGSAADLQPLLDRIDLHGVEAEKVEPDSPLFRTLIS